MPFIYDNTLRDIISDKKLIINHVAKLKSLKMNNVSLYLNNTHFSNANLKYALDAMTAEGINYGRAWTSNTEVDRVISWNKANSCKFKWMITEHEPYNELPTYAETMIRLDRNVPLIKDAGMKSFTYQGWWNNYSQISKYVDQWFIHAYRTPIQMTRAGDMFNYTQPRLQILAQLAKSQNKKIRFTPIFSNEPEFGQGYFVSRAIGAAYTQYKADYDRLASPDMKAWLILDSYKIFVTKFLK